MRVVTSVDKCIGAGRCVVVAPDVFDQSDEEGTVVVRIAEPSGELHEAVREAVRICPSGAIAFAPREGASS